jgi:hypothetical protein
VQLEQSLDEVQLEQALQRWPNKRNSQPPLQLPQP